MLGVLGSLGLGSGSANGDFAVRRGPQRSRRTLTLRAGAGLLALVLIAGGLWWALRSGTFAVARVESGSYRYTSEAELQAAFGEFLGRNIWTLRTRDIEARVARLPWVRDLQVRRRLPNRISVDFREWTPLLAVESLEAGGRMRDRLVLLADGRVLDFPAHLVLPGLPLLVGVPPAPEGESGTLRLPATETQQLLELISSMEDAGLEAACPVDFVVARQEGFAIVLQNAQGTVVLGRKDFGPRLARFMKARDRLKPGLKYDLRFADSITVGPRN